MRMLAIIAKHIVLPCTVWIGLFTWAYSTQAPEATYLCVIAFTVFWTLRAGVLWMALNRTNGIFCAIGQLVALALFLNWPVIDPVYGLILHVAGRPYQFLPDTELSGAIITWVTLAEDWLPVLLITTASALTLTAVAKYVPRSTKETSPTPGHVAPKPATAQPDPAHHATASKPTRAGYTKTTGNPLDAFR